MDKHQNGATPCEIVLVNRMFDAAINAAMKVGDEAKKKGGGDIADAVADVLVDAKIDVMDAMCMDDDDDAEAM